VQSGCPPEELADYLNACDVGVVSLKRGMAGVSVPSRFYNLLAAGKPVLAVCEQDSEMALVVREHGCGWVVEPGNARAVVEVLEAARADRSELGRMGQRARAAAEASLPRSGVVERYRRLLEDLDPRAVEAAGASR
jgi:glycosyltransferase involved in cell wall biosynthesis